MRVQLALLIHEAALRGGHAPSTVNNIGLGPQKARCGCNRPYKIDMQFSSRIPCPLRQHTLYSAAHGAVEQGGGQSPPGP